MPAKSLKPESRAAERMLVELLKSWPSGELTDSLAAPQHHVFDAAFLPAASHQAPRLPSFRMTVQQDQTVGRGLTQDRLRLSSGALREAERPIGRTTPSFDAVAQAVEAAWTLDDDKEAFGPAPEDSRAAALDDQSLSDESRFAARVVALKAAGVLDLPATLAGGSPAPIGYADRYGFAADEEWGDHLSALSAIVDLDPRLGHLSGPQGRARLESHDIASDEDDSHRLPRSMFL